MSLYDICDIENIEKYSSKYCLVITNNSFEYLI